MPSPLLILERHTNFDDTLKADWIEVFAIDFKKRGSRATSQPDAIAQAGVRLLVSEMRLAGGESFVTEYDLLFHGVVSLIRQSCRVAFPEDDGRAYGPTCSCRNNLVILSPHPLQAL